jgi:hypothetical protein
MNCSICASLSARAGLLVGMKILLSLAKRPWPARSRSGRAVSVGDFRPPERATRSAREEEDRSDIGGTDHHGMRNLSRARRVQPVRAHGARNTRIEID